MRCHLFGLLLVLTLLGANQGPAPRFDAWRIIGPGGAGGMFLPTISPHNPNIVLEHCDMTGSYISLDAGRSWRMFNLRGVTSAFAFDPKNPRVIYVGNHALWRSEDMGKTWSMFFPNPRSNTVEHMRDDHAAPVLTTDDRAYPGGRVRFIAVNPSATSHIYAAFAGARGTWLCFSKDRGATWSRIKGFPNESIRLIYFDQGVRVVSDSAVYAGPSLSRLPGPPGGIQSATGGKGLLYARSGNAVYVSKNGGKNWDPAAEPLPGATRLLSIACSALHPQHAYVGFVQGPEFGIAKTADGGGRWSIVYRESNNQPAPNVERAWIEDFYSSTGPIRDLGVSATDPNICYVTDSCPRSFRTVDGGKSWQQVISQHVQGDRWTTTGFDVTTCYGAHFDPFDFRNVFISYTDIGLFKSSDDGETWKSSIQGIPQKWRNTTYWIEFDPKVKGLVWGGFARTHDLPRAKMWRKRDPEAYGGGVGTSTDGGEHWTITNSGMPETAVTHILLDPDSPVGSRTLYACGFARGIYKSVDNGRTWALKIGGIEKKQPFAWRLARARDGTLYVVVPRRNEFGYEGDANDGALYRSTDGAEHWVKMKLPKGVNGPNSLTLDPENDRRMYLSAWGVADQEIIRAGGVYVSENGGDTWRNTFNASQHVYDVTVDPRDPKVLYNCGFESGAYRSADRGETWSRIRGFNFKWGHRVIPDPVDRSKIYVTTFGGSVWRGPVAGDPHAVEDILTPIPVAP